MRRQPIWIIPMVTAMAFVTLVHDEEQRPTQRPESTREARASGAPVRPYTEDLFRATETNTYFRRVLFTGERSQLVVMSIPPGESIGAERHSHVEQTIVVLSGSGQAVLNGRRTNVGEGEVIVVTPGTEHNLVNTGTTPLQLFTTYVPPNHIDRRVHRTKGDAERDVQDQRYGDEVR